MTANLFNPSFYRAANSDLSSFSDAQALSHFQTYGLDEGRVFSPLVNLNFYRSSNSDLASLGFTNRQLFDHLQAYGVAEGRQFSPLVDLNFYRNVNTDLASFNNEQAFAHLQTYGAAEGRNFSPLVDLNFYRSANSDLSAMDNTQALQHLVIYGLDEERSFSQFFNLNYYKANNPDLVAVGLDGSQLLEHFENYGLNEGRSFCVAFDVNYYRNANFDLLSAGFNNEQLLEHFEQYGLSEGRKSSPFFNPSYYIANNTDLVATGLDNKQAYDHFQLYGQREGRRGSSLGQQEERADSLLKYKLDLVLGADSNSSEVNGVAVDDAGNIYITGSTYNFSEASSTEDENVWVAKYDNTGNQLWMQQLATNDYEGASGIAVDSTGNVYVTGHTDGSLAGTNAGYDDAWIAKYDSSGNSLWTRQLGTTNYDNSSAIAVDNAGSVYVTGYTDGSLGGVNPAGDDSEEEDTWLAKYDSNGNQVWIRQLGTENNDRANGVAVDSAGSIYITGSTDGSLGGINPDGDDVEDDAWLAKYDSSGNSLWIRQFGVENDDRANGVAVDSAGSVYITGSTEGSLGGINPAGDDEEGVDAWLAKYDSNGTQLWIRQLGTKDDDEANGVAVDSTGNVYVTGYTDGSPDGSDRHMASAVLAQYNSDGELMQIVLKDNLGDGDYVESSGIAIDRAGNVYTTLDTYSFDYTTDVSNSDSLLRIYSHS